MKKTIIYELMFFILLISVLAIPPVQLTAGANGLDIRYPAFESFPFDKEIEFTFHVLSMETGLILNSSVNCSFHLYNRTGNHLLELIDFTPSHSYDYGFLVGGDNFTIGKAYAYNIYCQCANCSITTGITDLGGFVSKQFIITKDGANTNGNPVLIALMIGALLLALVFFLIGNSLDSEHAPMKMLFTFFTLFSGLAGANLALQIVLNSGFPLGVVNAIQTLYKISVWAMWLTSVYLIIYLIIWSMMWLKDVKNMK